MGENASRPLLEGAPGLELSYCGMRSAYIPRIWDLNGHSAHLISVPSYSSHSLILFAAEDDICVLLRADLGQEVMSCSAPVEISLQYSGLLLLAFTRVSRKGLHTLDPAI
ncbi:hypothetical protein KM043_013979 [Ampulex compressa]|nr:hypothetical protein KM043_013979 [Ampulex compressa]